MRYIVFFILLYGFVLQASGQMDLSYSQVYEWRADHKEVLPSWIFKSQDRLFVGVSDPYLKPEFGEEQAVTRALFWYGLQKGVEFNMLTDYFTLSELRSNTYDSQENKIMKLATMKFKQREFEYEIVEKYVSAYGETFVLVEPIKEKETGGESLFVGEFALYIYESEKFDKEIKLLLDIQSMTADGDKQTYFFSTKGSERNRRVESLFNGSNLYLPKTVLRYQDVEFFLERDTLVSPLLENSFWEAQMSSLLESVLLFSFPDICIKSTGERHVVESERQDELRKLLRQIVQSKIRVTIRGGAIQNNRLFMGWDIWQFN